jgi:hypothetical protein
MDADDDRRVDSRDVETDAVLVFELAGLTSVANLETVLVGSASTNRRRVAAERIAEDADALVVRALDAEVDGRAVRRTHEQDLAAGALYRRAEERVDIRPPRGAVHLGI